MRKEMSVAERICSWAFLYKNDDGGFQKSAFESTLDTMGGVEIWNSNEGQSTISFAPTRHFLLPDGSRIEVGYSGAWVLN